MLSVLKQNSLLLLAGFGFLIFGYLTGAKHDYPEYMKQWQQIIDFDDPWLLNGKEFYGNAYGPTHLIYAIFFAIHSLLPKLLAATEHCFVFYLLQLLFKNSRPLLLWVFFSPFFLLTVFFYADVDAHLGFFLILSFILLDLGRGFAAGIFLALATCLKFFPFAYLPIMAFDAKRRFRWLFVSSALLGIAALFGTSFALWGDSVLVPLFYAGQRPAKLLSIFAFLDGPHSFLSLHSARASSYLMISSAFFVYAFYWFKRREGLFCAVLLTLLIFLFYKVGHPQFYVSAVYLYIYWLLKKGVRQVFEIRTAEKVFFIWLSLITLLHKWMGAFNAAPWVHIRTELGLIHALLLCWLIWELYQREALQASRRLRN